MNIFYGLEVPLMGFLLLNWVLLSWLSGRLPFVSALNQVKKNIKTIRVLSFILLFITLFIIFEGLLGLSYLFEKDKMWINFILLIVPLLGVMFFSIPKTKSIHEWIDKSANDEISKETLQLKMDLKFILPFQFGVYTTMINFCFFLFPYGMLTFTDYLIPCTILFVLFIVLWFRYRHRLRVISRQDGIVKNALLNRIIRTSMSLILAIVSLITLMTMAVMTTLSNGGSEEDQIKSVKVDSGYLKSEGANIYYEVRGEGPPLLMIPGGGGDADFYTYVANFLADHYQVITYDRRGNSRSKWDDPQNFEVCQQARDVIAVLHATHHDSAFIFGNSSGAIIALELAEKYPDAIKAVVVHEPPTVKVLPDQEKWLTFFSDVNQTVNRFGTEVGYMQFIFSVGVPVSAFSYIPEGFQERNAKNTEILMKNEMQPFIKYKPNIEKIKSNKVKVIMAAGEMSLKKENYFARTSPIIAKQLNTEFVIFPGHHLSYFDMPKEWAKILDKTLKESQD